MSWCRSDETAAEVAAQHEMQEGTLRGLESGKLL
jgi:hypothetical protein